MKTKHTEDLRDAWKMGHEEMVARGGLGEGVMVLQAGGLFDVLQLGIPSPADCRRLLDLAEDWGDNWVCRHSPSISTTSDN
jgi:hypothetical protein